MRKVRLAIDELAVESFDAGDGAGKGGTVRGHDASLYLPCNSDGSQCATCQAGGCPQDTSTCFVTCSRTNGYQVCFC
ncbi:MAG TPA: hypothetical protein VHG91_08310 [Longimicrobium sp.]|nr:hypothetical protein [Longimicrobium sp.]